MAVTKNQEYTVTVEGYSGEGAGVARIDGFVVFVSGALRGEVCRVLILKVLKSAAFAKVLEVLAPSPHRIAPDCPYFPRCGGCTYRHMDYAEELALKRRRVQDIHKPQGAPDYALPDLPYAFKSLDDYDFIDMEEPKHESEQEEPLETDGAE